MLKKIFNIIKNILIYRDWNEITLKIVNKFEKKTKIESIKWLKGKVQNLDEFLKKKNYLLRSKFLKEYNHIEIQINRKLKNNQLIKNTSGFLPLIYFLIRLKKPKNIIETGVLYGFSSEIILQAIDKNKKGYLYSSDLPKYSFSEPQKIIGILVSKKLKKHWKLNIHGDLKSIDYFLNKSKKIDFFHYDSGKDYKSRKNILNKIISHFSDDGTLVMDDIQDNVFFKDFVNFYKFKFKIFMYQNKYIGLIEDVGIQFKKFETKNISE